MSGETHTDLHECRGHGSGKMLPGVGQEALKKLLFHDRRGIVRTCSRCIT